MSLTPKIVNFDEKWNELQSTLKKLFTLSNISRKVWNNHFSDVYALCVAYPQPFGDRLYDETKTFLLDHVKMLTSKIMESSRDELVTIYYSTWLKYSLGVRHLHCLFLYLNLHYVRSQSCSRVHFLHDEIAEYNPECMEIGELGLVLWKKEVITTLKDTLKELLLDGIASINVHGASDSNRHVYQGVVESFVCVEEYKRKDNLKFYEDVFEGPYLERCGKRFKLESGRMLQNADVSQYVESVWRMLEEERRRCEWFLHRSSLPKVEAVFVGCMVADHLALLLEECHSMVQRERFRDLRTMYLLLRLVDGGVEGLASKLLEHVKMKGLEHASASVEENDHVQFVCDCLGLHEKYIGVIGEFFANDKCLLDALDKACYFVVNKRHVPNQNCKSPEMLTKYCDMLLRKSCKGLSDAELEEKLGKCMIIFRYLDEKDVFQNCYSRMLAKRLIHQLSQSLDAEEAMIDKLKQACGYEFTSKLRKMLTDVKLSRDINREFSEHSGKENVKLGMGFFVHVLQAASWPMSQVSLTAVSLPSRLETALQSFGRFYHNRFSSRKLTFLHQHGQAEVKLNYLGKQYVVTMQMFQLAILLQFEKQDTWSCPELQGATQLAGDLFARLAGSLADSRLLLRAEAPGSPSALQLNLRYASKRTRLRVPAAVCPRESARELERARSSVEEDRKLYLLAAVVRVMKSRKVLNHNALVQGVLALCRDKFTADVCMIKKAIESLIEKQYIERTSGSSDEYSYIA
ncbi:cullin-2-like [Bacillus rossius redtenbacheri]|uniref:cullin-2-like n=1 Tax=Bacillus rossius redtenbacheri TaxID=93214 RepID=UPI002FDE8233